MGWGVKGGIVHPRVLRRKTGEVPQRSRGCLGKVEGTGGGGAAVGSGVWKQWHVLC